MKKRAVTLVCTLGILFGLNAQSFGLRGGVDLVGFTYENIDTQNETGYYIGAFYEFEKYAQIEVNYTSVVLEGDASMNFINIPLMFKVQLSKDFKFFVGPSLNMLLTEIDAGDASEISFSGNIGVSYTFSENYALEFRYSTATGDLAPDEDVVLKKAGFTVGLRASF